MSKILGNPHKKNINFGRLGGVKKDRKAHQRTPASGQNKSIAFAYFMLNHSC